MARALITVPANAKAGDIVEIRALVAHPMDTGYRPAADGSLVPRNLIRRFVCRFGDEVVFSAELFAAVSANPYIAFSLRATTSGTLSFQWEGDKGFAQTENVALVVA
jgi:sulfur-oxidizing protein SoxZ